MLRTPLIVVALLVLLAPAVRADGAQSAQAAYTDSALLDDLGGLALMIEGVKPK